jgi:uncharacterized membrane protein
MNKEKLMDEKPARIFLLCFIYGLHMAEEFTLNFVEWADRYFGKFDWTQNLIGNFMFFVVLSFGCYLYYKNPGKYLWAGMAGCMWVLSNSFLHISATLLGHEYSPGLVTAILLYIPAGLYFMIQWANQGVLTWKNLTLSFVVGGMIFMLIPTFVRAILLHAELAKLFHLGS